MKITKKGQELAELTPKTEIGAVAPAFALPDLHDQIVDLAQLDGQVILISIVPDIDTRVCSLQTKRFNQAAAQLDQVHFLTISNNTQAEQANWCAAEGVDMTMLHDTENQFGQTYGLYLPEINHLARAILIIDAAGKIAYQAISTELSEEPDYQEALAVAEKLAQQA